VAISAAGNHSTLLRNDGTVLVFGTYSNLIPADVANVIAISSGGDHDFALLGARSPVFTIHPLSRTVTRGAAAVMLAAKVVGSASNLSVAMQRHQHRGATNDTLLRTNLQFAHAGTYQLVASNASGCVTSSPALLLVVGPPVITAQPVSQTVNMGTNVQFSIAAVGYPPPAYQWRQNGTNPVGLNSANLTLLSVGAHITARIRCW